MVSGYGFQRTFFSEYTCVMSKCFIRARREDGMESVIDLLKLEDALAGGSDGEYYFLPESGETIFQPAEDFLDSLDDNSDEDDEDANDFVISDDALPIDPISSRVRFEWMEDFIQTVHSITAQSALRNALRQKKPFR